MTANKAIPKQELKLLPFAMDRMFKAGARHFVLIAVLQEMRRPHGQCAAMKLLSARARGAYFYVLRAQTGAVPVSISGVSKVRPT